MGNAESWRRLPGPMRARLRAACFREKGNRCTLRRPGCTGKATQLHHLGNRLIVGDGPDVTEPACASCNQQVGDPTKGDPAPSAFDWEGF